MLSLVCDMIFAVVQLPCKYEFGVFYLMHNGSDTSHCGGSVHSACFSFMHVLKLYYAEPPTVGLHITTDKSLIIDKNTLVRCDKFTGL